jgi:glyoxylase-like metal-dependent hydrolase (beta-lactamase superfamily II)
MRLSSRVFVALGMNPSPFSLRGTNTYLVGTGPKRILIDTGDKDFISEFVPNLRHSIAAAGAVGIEQIVVTHWHRDHIGGVQAVLDEFGRDIPVRKYQPVDGDEQMWGGEGGVPPSDALRNCNFQPLSHGEVLHTEGATLRVLYTPGHANDHVVLVLDEEPAMFTGDNVLGTGTPVFRDLPLYLASLRAMLEACPLNAVLYTSHGPKVLDGPKLIQEYIEHRYARVKQVKDVITAARTWQTAEQVARAIYTEVPENLIAPATSNTVQALRVLLQEGAVAHNEALDDVRWRLAEAKL